jgi:bifunctional non-homologous end joining protein LigD
MAISSNDLMHATLVRRPFNRAGWAFESKLDGFRGLARRERDHVELLSRSGRSIGVCFPKIARALKRIPGEWVLDGELVVPDERGHPSFEAVRRRGVMTRPK